MIETISLREYERRQIVADTDTYLRLVRLATDRERRYVVAFPTAGQENPTQENPAQPGRENPTVADLLRKIRAGGQVVASWPSDGSAEMDAYHRAGYHRAFASHEVPFEMRVLYHAQKMTLCRNCSTFQEVIDAIYNATQEETPDAENNHR